MDSLLHAFDFLERPVSPAAAGVRVVFGEDRFLRGLVRKQLELGVGEEANVSRWEGRDAAWRDVVDELRTGSLFGTGPRLVMVTDADDFISANRVRLEQLVDGGINSGCLVLDVASFPGNTRLYQAVARTGTIIQCRPPQKPRGRSQVLDEARLRKWIADWAERRHRLRLGRGQDAELLDLVGPELGLLDQELAKLALFADPQNRIKDDVLREVAGGWRTRTTWELLDAALDGHAAHAIQQLGRLLDAGEAPQAVFGAVSWSLRRFALAAALIVEAELAGRKASLPGALEQAGIRKWPAGALGRAERHLRQIGRRRAEQLYRRILETDRALKGSHAAPARARWALEHLLLWLSTAAADASSEAPEAADLTTRGRGK
jgi:DNA polymerase-3 subunit delta